MNQKVFLLDTMSFIYRAYHAAAHQKIVMSTKAGFPTGAVYIFARMFKKLMNDHKPEFMVACMEGGAETTFREKLYPEYKANRRGETPFDLVRQLPYIDRLLDLYSLPRILHSGFEADDIIGTLAQRFHKDENNIVYIVTGDKDMFQLVKDRIFIVNPMKDLLADAAKVELIVGVPPNQVTDVMALRGDAVDNVPGAPGVGDKGSISIIKEFGSITAALDRAAEIKRKSYRESLQNNRAQIELSHKLVTIDCNVPVECSIDSIKLSEPDAAGIKKLYKELEFSSMLKNEQSAAIEDFAEIVPPDKIETKTNMSEDLADTIIGTLF